VTGSPPPFTEPLQLHAYDLSDGSDATIWTEMAIGDVLCSGESF